MVTHQIPPNRMVFPLDGEDTLDAVSIVSAHTGEVMRFPRLWQTPDGVIDLNDMLCGLNEEREDARRHHMWICDYYSEQGAFAYRLAEKVKALKVAAEAGDRRQVERLLADLTRWERESIDEMLREIWDEHPEWAIADVGDDDEDGYLD